MTADTAIDPTVAAYEALANLEHIISESATLVSVQPHLPMVRCDHPQLVQIFQNLIGNAVKYRDPEHHARIEISAEIDEAMATITVQDDGPGIPIEHRSRIFGMFERINSHRAAGNGIGLAICQRIVAARGGRIWVDDGPGKGACFRFTLPRAG